MEQVYRLDYTYPSATCQVITSQVLRYSGVLRPDNTCPSVTCDRILLACVPTLCDVMPSLLTSVLLSVVIKVTLHTCVTLRTCLAGSQVRWQDGVTTIFTFFFSCIQAFAIKLLIFSTVLHDSIHAHLFLSLFRNYCDTKVHMVSVTWFMHLESVLSYLVEGKRCPCQLTSHSFIQKGGLPFPLPWRFHTPW